jgi:hypothetical protein
MEYRVRRWPPNPTAPGSGCSETPVLLPATSHFLNAFAVNCKSIQALPAPTGADRVYDARLL